MAAAMICLAALLGNEIRAKSSPGGCWRRGDDRGT
jgi:hypothetical protein